MGGESKEGPDVLSEHPAPVVTQPVGKARVHLSVERDGGGVNTRQTWKDTLKSQQTAVRLHLDTEGKIAFLSLPTHSESQEPFSHITVLSLLSTQEQLPSRLHPWPCIRAYFSFSG